MKTNTPPRYGRKLASLIAATVLMAGGLIAMPAHADSLPDHIVNGTFDYQWQAISAFQTDNYNYTNVDPATGDGEYGRGLDSNGKASQKWVHISGFDATQFAWKSTQTDTYVDGRAHIVEIQRSKAKDNMYAEITASQAGTYIYQDVTTTPGAVYTIRLRHSKRDQMASHRETMQVMVGAPGKEQAITMTRLKSDVGNPVGASSTTIESPGTNGWGGVWDTYAGTYRIPDGQTTTRFTFKSSNSSSNVTGNLVDDIVFTVGYPLHYDLKGGSGTGPQQTD